MLRRAHSVIGTKIHALDGNLGHVDDFYFDDLKWIVRYMIVRTGSWFADKHVMLSPSAIRDVVWEEPAVYVDLTQEQIKNSPDLDLEKPVTREQEMELVRHYQWPSYWAGGPAGAIDPVAANMGIGAMGVPGMGVLPSASILPPDRPAHGLSDHPGHIINDISSTGVSDTELLNSDIANSGESKTDAELRRAAQAKGLHHYLRGVKEVTGYHIAATDGEIGHVDDFFIDEEKWQIQYILVDTSNWLPGRKVLISPQWIRDIVWDDSQVRVNVTREQIKNSPDYDPRETVERTYEGKLHQHYGFPPYWA
jgi:uncharacterized protein YrrD